MIAAFVTTVARRQRFVAADRCRSLCLVPT